ncbi:gluconate 2-dehydrogenase subunit 3 family protein [Halopenitus persicus]|uniref:Gluconate 2-dehydrogenase subunit 3 n=1 Tax=Halopenitus persicus TaxID=1048396 RepID=A0A1H3EBP2_9EURY|nr:gluconate 2-dehydrogenase subunit 3 family protein [Halopenitus persicus]SDX75334.1 hypothetical protein SAMN05216564_101340 [Halopenitus persicus]
MELTRRDAVAALAAMGTGGAAVAGVAHVRDGDDRDAEDGRDGGPGTESSNGSGGDDDSLLADPAIVESFVAVAEPVYPTEIAGVEEFVGTVIEGRLQSAPTADGIRETMTELDELAEEWYGGRLPTIPAADRDRLLREVGADVADEVPDGTLAERVRYHVVNELLFALYASPTGGKLVGIENPQGHPGGTESYTRGPNR